MDNKEIIAGLKKYCAERMDASFASSDSSEDQQLLGEEQAIRDTIDLFLGKIRGLEHDIQSEDKKTGGMISGIIYRAVEPYDNDQPEFDCYLPSSIADGCFLGDCYVCDENGNVHPGLQCPVPMSIEKFGDAISRTPEN